MSNEKSLVAQWGSKIKNLLSPEKEKKPLEAPHISSLGSALYRKSGHFHVAVITHCGATVTDEILAGIRTELEAQAPAQFTVSFFDAQMDEQKLLRQVTTVVRSHTMPYDAIVTVGAMASQVATRTALYLNIPIPIIFTCISNPAHLGVIYPGKRPTRNVTGVTIPDTPLDEQVKALRDIKKDMRQVLLPYMLHSPWGLHQKMEMTNLFNCEGISVIPLAFDKNDDVVSKLGSHIYDVDTMITLREAPVINKMDSIVEMCSNYGVTLYAADLESVQQGAALGFASSDSNIGRETAQQLLVLFQEDVNPHEVPIKEATMNYQLAINTSSLHKQGVSLDKETLDSLENKILYGGDDNHDATEKNNVTR